MKNKIINLKDIIEVSSRLKNKNYWNFTNTIEFLAFSTKVIIIFPGLLLGIQFWWFYIFALVSSLTLVLTSTTKVLPTILYFNIAWSILALLAIIKHFIN